MPDENQRASYTHLLSILSSGAVSFAAPYTRNTNPFPPGTSPIPWPPPPRTIFVVQRGTALYEHYEDKFASIIGVFFSLDAANGAVEACRREFMADFGIIEEEARGGDDDDDDEFDGFCYEDRGGGSDEEEDGKERGGGLGLEAGGMPVGSYWEFDDGTCWYSCGVECWLVMGLGLGLGSS
jgi:hypothetical protein